MYPFFSGLGGYVFGRNKAGNLNPKAIGVANTTLPEERADDRHVGPARADQLEGQLRHGEERLPQGAGGLLGHGPVGGGHAQGRAVCASRSCRCRRSSSARCRSSASRASWSPGSRTRTAWRTLAKDLVASYIMLPASQRALAAANGRYPANTVAGKQVNDPVLAQFGRAGAGGVPMPNIPQMSRVGRARRSVGRSRRTGTGDRRASDVHDRCAQHQEQDRLDRPEHARAGARSSRAPASSVSSR